MKQKPKTAWFGGIVVSLALAACQSAEATYSEGAGVKLIRTPNSGIQPQAVTDARGGLHLIYFAGDPAAGDLFYVRRRVGEESFSAPIRVNSVRESAVATGTIRGGQIALGRNGRVHVAWNGSMKTVPEGAHDAVPMLYARMNDAGTAFEAQRNLMRHSRGLDGGGSVAADNAGHVYVAWHGAGERKGEQHRRVWLAASTDDGKTFSKEVPAFAEQTGACGCCGMRAFVDARGALYLLYRTATAMTERGMFMLVSTGKGKTFRGQRLDQWTLTSCPMSSVTMVGAARNLAAWENNGQVYFTALDGIGKPSSIAAPGETGKRKHPSIAVNARGETLLAWTEGTGWKRGGSVAWQVFDKAGNAIGARGFSDGVPVWGLVTATALANGDFAILY
jgi:hypothetical protein